MQVFRKTQGYPNKDLESSTSPTCYGTSFIMLKKGEIGIQSGGCHSQDYSSSPKITEVVIEYLDMEKMVLVR